MIEQLIPYLESWGHYALTLVLVPVLMYFASTFWMEFFKPGKKVSEDLASALSKLREIKSKGNFTDLENIRESAMVSVTLRACWDEFSDTLHGQKRADSQGVMQVNRYRATALANSFFTEQIVITTPLKAEFFKHLPGILTGIGIIGTFLGLILGLFTFDISKDAEQVRESLRNLLSSVGNAFIVSLTAIAMAMWITWLEKRTINKLYTELDELCGVIDSLFEAGAGEEYLQRLVDASETSATQAMQMKESIVTDLKQVLTELTNQQIATMTANSQQLSQSIGESITQGLVDPLTKISEAVQTVGNSQGEGVTIVIVAAAKNLASASGQTSLTPILLLAGVVTTFEKNTIWRQTIALLLTEKQQAIVIKAAERCGIKIDDGTYQTVEALMPLSDELKRIIAVHMHAPMQKFIDGLLACLE